MIKRLLSLLLSLTVLTVSCFNLAIIEAIQETHAQEEETPYNFQINQNLLYPDPFQKIASQNLKFDCGDTSDLNSFVGQCQLESEFFENVSVDLTFDESLRVLAIKGPFNAQISETIQSSLLLAEYGEIKGLAIPPFSGTGTALIDLDGQGMLFHGTIEKLEIDLKQYQTYNGYGFGLTNYQGTIFFDNPKNINFLEARTASPLLFGLGPENDSHPQVQALKNKASDLFTSLSSDSSSSAQNLRTDLQTLREPLECGSGDLNVFNYLDLQPSNLSIYNNLDLIADGTITVDPFSPNTPTNGPPTPIRIDLNAKTLKATVISESIKSSELFNNQTLTTSELSTAESITVDLSERRGFFEIPVLNIALPGGIGSLSGNVRFREMFSPGWQNAGGSLNTSFDILGFNLFSGDAAWEFDPQQTYMLDGEEINGVLKLDTLIEILALSIKGQSIIAHQDNKLAIDTNSTFHIELSDYFNFDLAHVTGRVRLAPMYIRGCFITELDAVDFYIPFTDHHLTLEGYISTDVEIAPDPIVELFPIPHLFAISGGLNEVNRIGFKYDISAADYEENYVPLIPIYGYDGECPDRPIPSNFLFDVLISGGLYQRLVENKFSCDVSTDDHPLLLTIAFGHGLIGAGWEEITGIWEFFKAIPDMPEMIGQIIQDPGEVLMGFVDMIGQEYGPPYCPGRIAYLAGKIIFFIIEIALGGAAVAKILSKIGAFAKIKNAVQAISNAARPQIRAVAAAAKLSEIGAGILSKFPKINEFFTTWSNKALKLAKWKPNAHHIIPNHFRKNPVYENLMSRLDGIWGGKFNINDGLNGVYIPKGLHPGGHTDDYYRYIAQRLQNKVDIDGTTKQDIIDEIKKLRNEIIDGDISPNMKIDPKTNKITNKYFEDPSTSKLREELSKTKNHYD